MKKHLLLLLLLLTACLSAKADVYLIDASATTEGAQITYRNQTFTVGTTAFSSFAGLTAVSVPENSTIYVAPGTYSGGTLSVSGLKVLGANAYCDWTATRSDESTINGDLTLNASNIEVNGFAFTGAGRIVANSATNAEPISSIKISYNYFSGSTVVRNDNSYIVYIGTRYNDATANSTESQCRYRDTEVSHNHFEGSSTHLAHSIGIMGAFGTTNIVDNYFYDGGNSVTVCHGQGTINVSNNKFHSVGVSTSNNTDGFAVGSFAVMAERCAYANSTTLNITDNEFDKCYGRQSYMAPLRVYPGGAAGTVNSVTPVNMSVNINRNTFTNKTSTATNANQLGENLLLYAEKSTTPNVLFNISDNHYDNRFYKYSYVTLADGLGQREIYSNYVDQFAMGGSYSTMGASALYGNVDISNHLQNYGLSETTVIQSMDIDPLTGDIYVLQLKKETLNSFCTANGLSPTECDPLTITRIPCTARATGSSHKYTYSTRETMSIAKTGHGVKLSVYRDSDGQLWLVTGAKGSDNGTNNDLSGKAICRFKFVKGQTIIADGRTNSAVSLEYYDHPKNYNNAYADIDPLNRYICFSSSSSGKRTYCVYDLDDFFNGIKTEINETVIATGDDAISGPAVTGDTGFQYVAYQSYTICGDYLYFLEGMGATSAQSTVIVSIYNWRTQQYLQRKALTYERLTGSSLWNEPEAITIRPDIFGNANMYLGISPKTGQISVFKLHIDRHVDSNGVVQGADTSVNTKHFNTEQYSGITMSKSADAFSLTYATLSETPSQSITITRTSKYMFGKWTGCITGVDGGVFAVNISNHSEYSDSFVATVTFTPDGLKNNYSANLRLSSPEADDIIIPISATYTPASTTPEISASTSSLSFNTMAFTPASQTVTISGERLAGDINLALSGDNADLFSLSTTSISQSDGSATVTVTYNPTATGTHSATLTASSTDATDVTVALSGSATPATQFDDVISSLTQGWLYSEINGNAADASSWLSLVSPLSRDIAYNNGKLYVANSNDSSFSIAIVDATTGVKIGDLSVDGISGGTYPIGGLNVIGGKLIASCAASATQNLKVYMWKDDSSAPTVILDSEPAARGSIKAGDRVNVWGDLTNGKLMFSDGAKLVVYSVTDGTVSTTPTITTLKNTLGSYRGLSDITLMSDGTYWITAKDTAPTHVAADGSKIETVNTTCANGYAVGAKFIDFGTRKYMAAMTYLNKTSTTLAEGAFTITDITDGINKNEPQTYPQNAAGVAVGLGATRNTNLTQSIVYAIEDKVLKVWVLSSYQGIGYWYYNGEKVSSVESIAADAMQIRYNGNAVSVVGADAAHIAIYSTAGTLVADVQGENTLDVSSLNRGVYIVSAIDRDGNIATKKIMK